MVKIGMLLPEADMVPMAQKVVKDMNVEIACLKAISSVDAVNEARLAVEAGAKIVIARGYQAKMIKHYTNIPLIEMKLHAQEIGLLLQKAKLMVKKEHPVIALIAFDNMLCDMSYMEELFGVTLKVAVMKRSEETPGILDEMEAYHPDLVIGGEITCNEAERRGYLTLFYRATEESIKEALESARAMAFAVEIEKQNTAQFETVLDTSFNGIVKVNMDGNIIVVNKLVEKLIGKEKEDVVGCALTEVFPQIDMELVGRILKGESENLSTSISLGNKAFMLLMAPIEYDEVINGAIITLHQIADGARGTKRESNKMLLHGFPAKTDFGSIYTENAWMKKVLEDAKTFALSESPILIYGQAGIEDYLIAEAIHNNSNRKAGPYVSINMRGMDKEHQMEELFRREPVESQRDMAGKGAMIKADHGTLFIKGMEHLTLRVQHQILRTMLSRAQMRTDAQPIDSVDVRIIGSSKVDLKQMVQQGTFSEEFYYMLQGLTLKVPSLNQRAEDLRHYFDREFGRYSEMYNRHLKITDGGYQKLSELPWNGNMIQLKAFCERLVLSTEKRVVDEIVLQKLFEELYPEMKEIKGESRMVIYRSPESTRLAEILERCHGNRNQAAKELGISTTTLWRRMKKYGVEAKYEE
ncbi:sigma 54-interacting transcriptional regulator [Coprococcus comes]|uniref:sigma 54-interacting transcriptional regulator n=1 Tax=Coprococcus comes TaxID=410072 RepID=UPI00189AE804|nr:sigma 54-interacting transcriptional regulator [Coprococcus comes]